MQYDVLTFVLFVGFLNLKYFLERASFLLWDSFEIAHLGHIIMINDPREMKFADTNYKPK